MTGTTRPYKVDYRYPNGIGGRGSRPTADEAHRLGADIAGRGGSATVHHHPNGGALTLLGRYGPDVAHEVEIGAGRSPRATCTCGWTGAAEDALYLDGAPGHARLTGHCGDCLGTGEGADRFAPDDSGIGTCAACGGQRTADAEAEFWSLYADLERNNR